MLGKPIPTAARQGSRLRRFMRFGAGVTLASTVATPCAGGLLVACNRPSPSKVDLAVAEALSAHRAGSDSDGGFYDEELDPPPARADEGNPGRRVVFGERPSFSHPKVACAPGSRLCVHADAGTNDRAVAQVFDAAERALATLTGALALPAPAADPETGAYDVYVIATPARDVEATTWLGTRDMRGGMDRASAFSVVTGVTGSDDEACAVEAEVARAVADAIRYRVAPATDRASALSETTYLARLVSPCSDGFPGDVATYQAAPFETPFGDDDRDGDGRGDPARDPFARGAWLWPAFLDGAYGTAPGAIVRGLWALTPSRTDPSANRFHDEPDSLDVLRASLRDAVFPGSTLDDVWLEYAIARAFVGTAAPPSALAIANSLGSPSAVRLDWDIPFPTVPRRLASPHGIAPLGAAYVALRGVPAGARLRVELAWEEHASMRWAAVKIGAHGERLTTVLLTSFTRGTSAQRTLADLEGAGSVLLVGVNLGDPAFDVDPDDAAWEPHGYLVTVAAE